MDRERLKRIRNFQSKDWYPALIVRPLCILVMLVIADWRFLTPNRLTHLANLCKLAAAALIALGQHTVLAVVLLQLGLLFDHLDGTMARYRRTWSAFGSFYDKVSDGITWFIITLCVSWSEYRDGGDAMMLVLGAVSSYSLLTLGYMKWVASAEENRLDWYRATSDPGVIAKNTKPPSLSQPPERSLRDWLAWFAWSMAQIVRFEETDLFFWTGLALLVGRVDLLLWGMAITQGLGVLIMFGKRGLDVHRVDVAMRPYRS